MIDDDEPYVDPDYILTRSISMSVMTGIVIIVAMMCATLIIIGTKMANAMVEDEKREEKEGI